MKTGIFKHKMNKYSIEIMRNFQIICFINKDKIKKQKKLF